MMTMTRLLFLIFVTETISRTDEGQPRPKYIFNKCGTNIYFFTIQRFGPSPSPNLMIMMLIMSMMILMTMMTNDDNDDK